MATMMRIKHNCLHSLLLFVAIVLPNLMYAQSLTEEQKKIFQDRVKQKVEDFEFEMTQIVNTKLSNKNRAESVRNLLNLFIGQGDPYYYDEFVNADETIRLHSSGVTMEVSSVNRSRTTTQKLKKYIYGFFNPETYRSGKCYSYMKVKDSDALRVDNIERVGDHYECIAYLNRHFDRYRDGHFVCSNKTVMKIRCYVNYIESPTNGDTWIVKLGDIYTVSIERTN